MPGRNADRQLETSATGSPGQSTTKPGRFALSEPSPYVTHAPMLGRDSRSSPQFISRIDCSWLGVLACIERRKHISSTWAAVRGKISLTSMPLRPCFVNLNGDGRAAPVARSVVRLPDGSVLPSYFFSSGLGSKVSTCDGPPLR